MAKLDIYSTDEEERGFFSEGEYGLGQIRPHSAIPFESHSKKRTKGSEGQIVALQPAGNETGTRKTDQYDRSRKRREYAKISSVETQPPPVPTTGPQPIPLPPVPDRDRSVITEIPVVSRVIQCSSKWIIQHRKQFYVLMGMFIILFILCILANILVTMIFDQKANNVEDTEQYSFHLAPLSVFEYELEKNWVYIDEITIKLSSECQYVGVLQISIESNSKVIREYQTVKIDHFKELVRYWPYKNNDSSDSSVTGNITCTEPTTISWTWQDTIEDSTQFNDEAEYTSQKMCNKSNLIKVSDIMKHKPKSKHLVKIKAQDESLVSACFEEKFVNIKDMKLNNLGIGEENNSTTVNHDFTQKRRSMFISTKYVFTNEKNYEEINVTFTLVESGMFWEIGSGISSPLVLMLIFMISLCVIVKICNKREYVYFTIVLRSLKEQEHLQI